MLKGVIGGRASPCLYCRRLLPQSYARSHLNEMCPAAAVYISGDEEGFLPSTPLKIQGFRACVAFVGSLSLSLAEKELLQIAPEARNTK